ncbi:MAG: nucleic acid-binding protein [Halococcoides sp.]
MTVAVADAGPLIHLGEIGALDLLETFDDCLVPETVVEEVERGGAPPGLDELRIDRVTAPSSDRFDGLDPGERAALTVSDAQNAVVLTDDLEAREAAQSIDIEVRGSIGVIALGYTRGLIDRDEAVTLMRALHRDASLFVSESVVEQGIALLDERS